MKDWSETIKNYCQIAAILIAGWWTYHLFGEKDAPGLERRGNTFSDLKWFETAGSEDSEVDFFVTLENKGTTSFDVAKVRVRAWEFDYGNAKEHLEFVDLDKVRAKPTFFDKEYPLTKESVYPFPSHFAPGAVAVNSFVWLLKDPDCKKRVCFLAEFLKPGDKSPTWWTYQWGQECSADQNSPRTKKEKVND
jgi:hypothetical protein